MVRIQAKKRLVLLGFVNEFDLLTFFSYALFGRRVVDTTTLPDFIVCHLKEMSFRQILVLAYLSNSSLDLGKRPATMRKSYRMVINNIISLGLSFQGMSFIPGLTTGSAGTHGTFDLDPRLGNHR